MSDNEQQEGTAGGATNQHQHQQQTPSSQATTSTNTQRSTPQYNTATSKNVSRVTGHQSILSDMKNITVPYYITNKFNPKTATIFEYLDNFEAKSYDFASKLSKYSNIVAVFGLNLLVM